MIKKMICCALALLLLMSTFPMNATAVEDTERFTGEPPKVETYSHEEMVIGQSRPVLWSARGIEDDYPNNPPADVDTVEEKVDWIAQKCRETGLTEDWDIALWLHDWLIYNANYDYTFTYYFPEGVLLEGTGVCMSYALAYCLLLDEFSIENQFLSADEMDHAWNLVKIDGEWCHVDCTWDDPNEGGHERHTYFGMTDKMIGADHVWNTSRYPACTSKINYHPIRMGYLVFETVEEMMEILDREATAKNMVLELYYIGGDPNFRIMDHYSLWRETNMTKYQINGWGGGWYTETWLQTSLYYWGVPVDHIHDYREEVISPTCTEDGYTIRRCSCEGYYIDHQAALGHSFGEWTETKAATCTENGEKARKCTACGDSETEMVEAFGHSYGSVVKEPSCTEQGYTTHTCADCGHEYADGHTNALGHSFVDYISDDNATCTEDGTKTAKCERCDERDIIADAGTAKGHTFGEWAVTTEPTCTEKGEKNRICTACGDSETETVEANGHSYGSVVTEATCEADGFTTHTCSACGDSYVDSPVEAQRHSYVDGVCENCGESIDSQIPGDIDGSKNVDVDDVLALLWNVLFPDDYPIDAQADFDGNGATDVDDVLALLWHVLFPDDYPLAPEVPEPSEPVMGTVTVDNLNVREEPVAASKIVARLAVNTRVEILSQKVIDGITWGQIAEGWVVMNYVQLDAE